jgi:hypothetical protein
MGTRLSSWQHKLFFKQRLGDVRALAFLGSEPREEFTVIRDFWNETFYRR